MPKIEPTGGIKKISLAQIIESGNVRNEYNDISELAASIKAYGQLQPVLVKAHGKNADGIDEYELVAGHRRIRALRHLCENGDDFSRIDSIVVSGDKLTLQLIENLQRSDLTVRERERGIYEMTKDGKVKQCDVASMLGKNEQYIWRHISAYKIREMVEKTGIDTSGISTNTLCEIASAADGDIPLLIERLKNEGGTLAAARRIGREYRGADVDTQEQPEPKKDIPSDDAHGDDGYDLGDISLEDDDYKEPPSTPIKSGRDAKPANKPAAKSRETRTLNDFDPPHKKVDINDVLVIIKDYIEDVETTPGSSEAAYKKEACWDIIALLHEGL
jgi:ParB family chromosome partitioning protein